jgi:PhnB protein
MKGKRTGTRGECMATDYRYIRHGFGTVRPFLYGHLGLDEMVKEAFGALEIERHQIAPRSFHIEVQIGDSFLLLATGDPLPAEATEGSIYLYVPDVDAAYRHALKCGAKSVAPPEDKPYAERAAGVKDSSGNTWWISTYKGA